MKAFLVLEDKTVLLGNSFGAEKSSSGEVVFSTAMTGYVEALTDPSYAGQILVLTYPLVGNYGVPNSSLFQSKKIQVSGLVVTCHSLNPSHHQSQKTLDVWLKENFVPGISGIDTRALTQKLCHHGTMLGKIIVGKDNPEFYDPNKENVVAKVSLKKPEFFQTKGNGKTVCLLDCGYKKAILNSFLQRGVSVWVIPWNYNPFEKKLSFQGIVISNGPGDPKMADESIQIAAFAIKNNLPTLGICLGSQILALAAGGKTFKLKFGHRSVNQPVKDLKTGHCFITSQNHEFAIDTETLPKGWHPWFVNLNDQTCEGIFSENQQFLGVQFHPEGHPGPEDTWWVFDEFVRKL